MRYLRLILTIILIVSNCAKIRINKDYMHDSYYENWEIYGGDINRESYTNQDLDLPLKLAWKFNTSSAIGKSLIVADGIIYLGTMDGRLYAVNLQTGKKIGNEKFDYDLTCAYHNKNLYLARRYGNETLFKYNLKRGKVEWKIDAGDIASEPLFLDSSIVVTALYKHIDRYNLSNGERIWQFEIGDQIRSSPSSDGKCIVFGADDGFIYAIDKDSGTVNWKFKTDASVQATPVISNGIVYIGSTDNYLYALDIDKGTLRWKFDVGGQVFHAVAIDKKNVIVGSTNSNIYCLDRVSGLRKWSFKAESVISTSPVIVKNKIFFGSYDHHYYAVDIEKGKELWKFKTKGRIRTAPVIWGNYLIGASENNHLYAFSANEEI